MICDRKYLYFYTFTWVRKSNESLTLSDECTCTYIRHHVVYKIYDYTLLWKKTRTQKGKVKSKIAKKSISNGVTVTGLAFD